MKLNILLTPLKQEGVKLEMTFNAVWRHFMCHIYTCIEMNQLNIDFKILWEILLQHQLCLKISQLHWKILKINTVNCTLIFRSLRCNAIFLVFINRYIHFNLMTRKNVSIVSNITLPGSVKKVKRTKDNFLKLVSH